VQVVIFIFTPFRFGLVHRNRLVLFFSVDLHRRMPSFDLLGFLRAALDSAF
jgi:hypothetical protein